MGRWIERAYLRANGFQELRRIGEAFGIAGVNLIQIGGQRLEHGEALKQWKGVRWKLARQGTDATTLNDAEYFIDEFHKEYFPDVEGIAFGGRLLMAAGGVITDAAANRYPLEVAISGWEVLRTRLRIKGIA